MCGSANICSVSERMNGKTKWQLRWGQILQHCICMCHSVCVMAANVVTFSSPITEKHILHAKWQMASECVCARLIKGHTGSNGAGSPWPRILFRLSISATLTELLPNWTTAWGSQQSAKISPQFGWEEALGRRSVPHLMMQSTKSVRERRQQQISLFDSCPRD